MQDIVTLFGSRPQEFTRTIPVSVAGRDAFVLIHGADKSISVPKCKSLDDFDDRVQTEADKLGRAGAGGGVIASASPNGRGWVVRVEARPGRDFQPATQALVLRPGYPAVLVDLVPSKPIRLDPGARLILPATDSDARNLSELLVQLDRFSPDVAWTTLAALCAPALDLRVRRLEERLERGGASSPSGTSLLARLNTPWRAVWGLMHAHPVAWSAYALALLLCLATAWIWLRPAPPDRTADGGAAQQTGVAMAGASGAARAAPDKTSPPKETGGKSAALTPRYRVLDALRAQLNTTQDTRLQGLYSSHFKALADMQPGHEDKVFQDPAFAYGLVWLLAAQANDESIWPQAGVPALDSPGHDQQARAALKTLRKGKKLTPEDRALLVEVTCEAFPESFNSNRPGLPAATDEEPVDLPPAKCWNSPPLSALQQLTRAIAAPDNTQSPGGGATAPGGSRAVGGAADQAGASGGSQPQGDGSDGRTP